MADTPDEQKLEQQLDQLLEDNVEERMNAKRRRFARMTEGKSVRFKRRAERTERVFNVGVDIPHARVLPKNEELREALVHPLNNIGFRKTGSVDWPLDQFTLRRLRDGDVTLDPEHPHQQIRAVQVARPSPPITRTTPRPRPAELPSHEEPKK